MAVLIIFFHLISIMITIGWVSDQTHDPLDLFASNLIEELDINPYIGAITVNGNIYFY